MQPKKSTRLALSLIALASISAYSPLSQATYCPGCCNTELSRSQSLSTWITVEGTGQVVSDGMIVPAKSYVRLDGHLVGGGGCAITFCDGTSTYVKRWAGRIYYRALVSAPPYYNNDLFPIGAINNYGTLQETDSRDTSNSTGPLRFSLNDAGVYRFIADGVVAQASPYCEDDPDLTLGPTTVTVNVTTNDDAENLGPAACNGNVGYPVNVTNGNMYLQHEDASSGPNASFSLVRTFNSRGASRRGYFGYGWTSLVDESLTVYAPTWIRLNRRDGQGIYLSDPAGTGTFRPQTPSNFSGVVIRALDGKFTLTKKDSSVEKFSATGQVLSIVDRNANAITFTYDVGGRPIKIADSFGRTLSLSISGGTIVSASDGSGTIATYSYSADSLRSVQYADGSKHVYSYAYDSKGNPIIKSLSDAGGTVIESYTYGSDDRVKTTTGRNAAGGIALAYINQNETAVTDALGKVTKFFFQRIGGTNKIVSIDNGCNCSTETMSSWAYDVNGNVIGEANNVGAAYTYGYDAAGNLGTATDPLGVATTFTYDAEGHMTSFTNPTGTSLIATAQQGENADEPGLCPASGMGVDKNSCLNACAAGGVVWRQFCEKLPDLRLRAICYPIELASETFCRGWCFWHF